MRRSHYLRIADEEDQSEEAKRARQERERFAVAAVAFCLKHNAAFLNHFWQRVCRMETVDPKAMPRITNILLEPPHWADLRLVSEFERKRYVWVVEVKAGAPLENKQRPDHPEFVEPNIGYGSLFAQAEPAAEKRYIILGESSRRKQASARRVLGISVQERNWLDLADSSPRNSLVDDLFETLAELKIHPFYMEKVQQICVTGGMRQARDAWLVLTTVCKEVLDVRSSYQKFWPDTAEDNSGSFGIWIRQPPEQKSPSEQHRKLRLVTRSSSDLAWFGYEFDARNNVNKSVWFYFDNPKRQASLLAKLKPAFPTAVAALPGGELCVIVRANNKTEKDFNWFKRIFEQALR